MGIIVNSSARSITFSGKNDPCRIGRKGMIAGEQGREGDEKTPLGDYALRFGLYRADRLPAPNSDLTFRALRANDGWCDDVNDPAYNRLIRLPYPASHEKLWREDGAYDVILVMSHNDSPPQRSLGSAVFIHVAQPDDRQTLGCIALEPEVMVRLLPHLKTGLKISIQE
ncbi:MAG: L,D-transpeptidase family protein [Hellea sp.]